MKQGLVLAQRVSLFRRGNAATTCINTSLRAALKQHKIVKMFAIFAVEKLSRFYGKKIKKEGETTKSDEQRAKKGIGRYQTDSKRIRARR